LGVTTNGQVGRRPYVVHRARGTPGGKLQGDDSSGVEHHQIIGGTLESRTLSVLTDLTPKVQGKYPSASSGRGWQLIEGHSGMTRVIT